MRSVEEIRTEMADVASMAKASSEAGLEVPFARNEGHYQALAWVLQEPWKAED